ncbi:MAG: Gfo/Idh/MocA family oxidoreductase, partial [Spirochaetaceae bacterium]|nr:Gfo/Idh/MocA family oxidoreductase [Spirochaetaceae bacterium]
MERERPDLVSICTSSRPRARVLLDVAEIGAARGLKAIRAEKPLAISVEEGDRMVAACRRLASSSRGSSGFRVGKTTGGVTRAAAELIRQECAA